MSDPRERTTQTRDQGGDRCPRCGSALPARDGLCAACLLEVGLDLPLDEPPPEFPGYRVERLLGEGGMGSVFLAEELDLGRRVALKLLTRERPGSRRHDASRLLREARTMAAVEHPHVVTVYRIGRTDDGRDFLAMEYVEGETLSERIERRTRLPPIEILDLVRQATEALSAAWEHRVVHRDVKPSNLFVDRFGRLRVGDFGLALPTTLEEPQRLTGSGTILGTPSYCPPEQVRGEDVDFRADLYSLGIVLYEMSTGRLPFTGRSPMAVAQQHLLADLPPFPDDLDVPSALEDLTRWLTAKRPEERPGSHGELLHAIDGIRGALVGAANASLDDARTAHLPGVVSIPRGPRIALRCDRRRQVLAFAHHFREHRAREPGRPVAYLVDGDEGQCHDSLIERCVHEHVETVLAAEERTGELLVRRFGWPEAESAAELRAYLRTDLFTEIDPSTRSLDLAAEDLVRSDRLSQVSAVILHHELRADDLRSARVELARWYLDEWWPAIRTDATTPQVVLFLSLVTAGEERGGWWRDVFSPARQRRRSAELTLRRLFDRRGRGISRLRLHRLDPIRPDDVGEWIARHRLAPSEKERLDRTAAIFRRADGETAETLPMAEVEVALRDLHIRTLRDKGLHP